MKICIKGNEFNPSFVSLYGEQKAIEQGYTIYEVPLDYVDCAFEDFDNNGFNEELYNQRKSKEYAENRINKLKQNLANTDYQAIKFAEGRMTEEEYAPIGEQRQAWRDEINRLEVGNANE